MAHLSLPAIFLVNAGLSFALSLLLAFLLGPAGFGRYAVALSVVVVINTTLFEWLRLSTTRFYSEKTRAERPAVRRTLGRGYAAMSALLVLAAGTALALDLDLGLPASLLAAAAICGLSYGLCEYQMALARSRFLGGAFATLALGRGLLGFVFAAGAAFLYVDAALALLGMALSAALVALATRRRLADPPAASGRLASRDLLATFARYGLPLVAASALYQLAPLLNRSLLAGRAGFAEAGYFSLASEIATRLFQNLGSAMDIALFQIAVRADETDGREAAERQVARNAALIGAVVLPAAFGLVLVWPAFEAVFVPASFRGRVEGPVLWLVPALAAFALVQYAINPVFQLRSRTAPVVVAAAVALAANAAIVVGIPSLAAASAFAAAQCAGMAAGAAILAGLAWRAGAKLPLRDLGVAAAAAAVMAALLWPLRGWGSPLVSLVGLSAAGALIYGALAVAGDVAGLRAIVLRRLRRR